MPSTTDRIDKAYSDPPFWYDLRGFGILTLSYQTTLPKLICFFSKNISDKHLVIAVGSGRFLQLVLAYKKISGFNPGEIVAIDCATRMIESAKKKFPKRNIRIQLGDVEKMDFADSSFLSINIANSIHCFSNLENALEEIHRVLHPQGRFAFNALINPQGPKLLKWAATHINSWGKKKELLYQSFEPQSLIKILEKAGFRIIESSISGNTLQVIAEKSASPSI